MVAGRQGMRMEALKFSVYLGIPLVASAFFNEPETVKYFVDYFKYVEYPASPNTNIREQLEEQAMELKRLREQRKVYAKQLRDLDSLTTKNSNEGENRQNSGWWGLGWVFGSKSNWW